MEQILRRVPFLSKKYTEKYPTPRSYQFSNFAAFCSTKLENALDPLHNAVMAKTKGDRARGAVDGAATTRSANPS